MIFQPKCITRENTGGLFHECRDSLLKINCDGKRYSIDPDKVNLLEALVDEVIHFSDFDYRCKQIKEWVELYHNQSEETKEIWR